ncbi:MAG: MBL fold metallo-hydrolase [Theionarchaea archaeon]|nr:MBL fold metallo-hydrolase [Theionarchaea archaeon]MBU7022493.1 MBL fold metallo-hydrolase [Theionarchaea archaeon]
MSPEIKTIRLAMPFKLGSVNCYLVKTHDSYVLIDTGSSNKRSELEKELESAGCNPGNLRLIIITHGDFDHTGNCAYLREKFNTRVAMHHDDKGMAEHGDMFWNRKKGNVVLGMILPVLSGFGQKERFEPDVIVDEGYDLSEFGFDARVLHLPGHSRGSIGILTADGTLFCGDLLENRGTPGLSSIMDDPDTAHASVERLKNVKIQRVYPGHGEPFLMEEFMKPFLQRAEGL